METIAILIKDKYGLLPKRTSKELIDAETVGLFAIHKSVFAPDLKLPVGEYTVTFLPLGVAALFCDDKKVCERFIDEISGLSWKNVKDKKYICQPPSEDVFEYSEFRRIQNKYRNLYNAIVPGRI